MAAQLRGGASVKGQLISNGIATFKENVTMEKDLTVTGTLKNSSDKSYVTTATTELESYYKKSETYTKSEVQTEIANSAKLEVKLFDTLPEPEEKYKNVIALVPIQGAEGSNVKNEYICINKGTTESPNWEWELIGTTTFQLTWTEPTTERPNQYLLNSHPFTLATTDHCGIMTKEQATAVAGIGNGALTVTLEGNSGTGTFTANQSGASTIALTLPASGVTAGTYGSVTEIPQITVDEKGRITAVEKKAITMPTVNNGKLTIDVGGTPYYFTANSASDVVVSIHSAPAGMSKYDGTLAFAVGEGATDKAINMGWKPTIVQFYDNSTQENVILPYKLTDTGITVNLGYAVTTAETYIIKALYWTSS